MRISTGRSTTLAAAGALAAVALLVTGCSSGGAGSDASMAGGEAASSDVAGRAGVADERAVTQERGPGRAQQNADGANRAPVQTRAVIHTGQIALVSEDLGETRSELQRLLDGFGGYIAEEETSNDVDGDTARSRLVARVPSPAFDDAMTAFADLGRLESTDRQSEDVTTEVIDVEARVRAQDKSLQRLEDLLSRAEDLGDVIRLETEISERQAALDSLKAQRAYLSDQTSLSTVTVYLSTPPETGASSDPDRAGFLAGLSGGWHALTVFLVGAATVLGAVLPFAAVLAMLGVPALLLLRRFRSSASTPG